MKFLKRGIFQRLKKKNEISGEQGIMNEPLINIERLSSYRLLQEIVKESNGTLRVVSNNSLGIMNREETKFYTVENNFTGMS